MAEPDDAPPLQPTASDPSRGRAAPCCPPALDVTFLLFTYNQERFIRDALLSALDQDYPCLDIVVSDDASSDRTAAIAEDIARQYSGPHRLQIHCNETNLGLIDHLNLAVTERVKTRFVVIAAGDDISLPHRTSRLVAAWKATQSSALVSNAFFVDPDGHRLNDMRPAREPYGQRVGGLAELGRGLMASLRGQGATLAIDRSLFSTFGGLPPSTSYTYYEDRSILFWASICHGVCVLEEPLVGYRVHDDNLGISHRLQASRGHAEQLRLRRAQIGLMACGYRHMLEAARLRRGDSADALWDRIEDQLSNRLQSYEIERELMGKRFVERLRYLGRGLQLRPDVSALFRVLILIVSPRLYTMGTQAILRYRRPRPALRTRSGRER